MKRINDLKIVAAIIFTLLCSGKHAFPNGYFLTDFQYSGTRWTGVAASGTGRVFVCYPRCGFIPFSVAEIVNNTLLPFPNSGWNSWASPMPPDSHFVCAQSLYIDKEEYLWILDAACINGTIINGGPKLVKIDLQTEEIVQVIYLGCDITPQGCYLNDFRIDCIGKKAYITDSGLGAIIVTDLVSGQSWRLLESHYSVKAENILLNVNGQTVSWEVHADGLAISNDRSYLYYKALTAYNLYRIPTAVLTDTTLSKSDVENAVEFVAVTFPSESIAFDSQNNLFMTSVQDNSIYYLTPDLNLELAITDERLKWPDSFSITYKGEIYVTTSRLFYQPGLHGLYRLEKTPSSIVVPGSDKNEAKIQVYPNPFTSKTTIQYTLENQEHVHIAITDITGKNFSVITDELQSPGLHSVCFNGTHLPDGIYFCIFRHSDVNTAVKILKQND